MRNRLGSNENRLAGLPDYTRHHYELTVIYNTVNYYTLDVNRVVQHVNPDACIS